MASSNPYIRDVLVVDDRVQQFYNGFTGPGPVFLIGREVRLAPGFLFRARTVPLVIVADFFDGNGGVIDARGPDSGIAGTTGANGVTRQPSTMPDPSGFDRPIEAGGPGDGGGTGGAGGTGNTVTIYARRTANVNLTVQGGRGGPGGNGGNGSAGVPGVFHPASQQLVDLTPDDETDHPVLMEIPAVDLPGTPGGDGGPGGTGGTGGTGGVIRLTSVVDDTAPQLACHGGEGGPGGPGGAAGPDGALSPVGAMPGPEGSIGGEGGLGTIDHRNVSEADYLAGLRPVLDSPHGFANHWAPYRIVVAEYFYRRYNPAVVEDSDKLALAALELQRALELQPDNSEALRLQAQLVGVPRTDDATGEVVWVGGGNNALGLPPDFDVVPRFQDYIEPFTAFGSQVLDFLEIGAQALVESTTIERLRRIVALQTDDARAVQQNLAGDLAVADIEKRLATDEASFADKRLQQTQREITAALDEMKDEPFTIGAFVGTLAEVAVAVAAVAAAVGTGGAALVALVPAAVALAGTVYEQGGPVLDAVFEGKDPDTAGIEGAYEKVGKKPDQVISAGKKVIDFVKVIEKLNAKASPDNAKHLALVTRAAELAHQVLLASHKVTLADQRLDNARAKVTRAAGVVQRGEDLEKSLARDVESVRKAGLFAVSVAESRADALLDMAFRAQRSVEIYTLLPQVGSLHLDAGSLHPDVWRRYQEGEIDSPDLHVELTRSWGRLLQPIRMQSEYVTFFTPPPVSDLLRLTFDADDPQLEALRTTGGFTFRVDPLTIPAGRHDAKIQSVQLAFVGAAHPDLQVSCEVRHGGRYEQRLADGSVHVQLLRPQLGIRRAGFDPIPPDTTVTHEPPLDAPQSLAFWGRGIGGEWEVEVVGDAVPDLDLDGLTRVQVWIGYQFRL